MKKSSVALVSALIILVAPVVAFDFGKVLSDAVDKTVRDSVGSVQNSVKKNIEQALSSAMPNLNPKAKLDDGQGMDLSKGVTIFGYNGCPHCRNAYAYLNKNNIRYTLMDTQKDTKAARIAKQNGIRGVPVIYVSGERKAGFSNTSYTQLFKKHGLVK